MGCRHYSYRPSKNAPPEELDRDYRVLLTIFVLLMLALGPITFGGTWLLMLIVPLMD